MPLAPQVAAPLDEGELVGAALGAAGAPTTVRRFDGLVHGFFGMGAVSKRAAEAVRWTCAADGALLR